MNGKQWTYLLLQPDPTIGPAEAGYMVRLVNQPAPPETFRRVRRYRLERVDEARREAIYRPVH